MRFQPSPEQQAIIDHPLTPLRVAAGAGTGKTTTMAARIARLVEQDGIEPEQILGITFTNKAAEEMADRIRQFLSGITDRGREVEVHTYHGFAHEVLSEFGVLVEVERDVGIITPTFARQLFREVLNESRLEHVDLTWPPSAVAGLVQLAGGLGDNLVEAAALVEVARRQGPDDPVWAQRGELAEVLVGYADRKRGLRAVDYPDLIARAHRLFVEHPDVAARIRSRYRAVLLDEYQDTNPAQREMLRAVFGGGFPVTAIGDSDQTIYEWRGASLENFQAFPQHFTSDGRPAASLPLTLNRRSGRLIIGLANRVRKNITSEPSDGDLQPLPDAERGYVGTAWLRTAADEAAWIADQIHHLGTETGLPWRHMAVLFRKNKDIRLIRDALAERDVPVEVASIGGLLDVPEVVDVHAWLRILARPDDGAALVRILTGSRLRLGLGDLAPLANWVRARSPIDEIDEDHEALPSHGLLEAVDRLDETHGLRQEAREALIEFQTTHRALLEVAQGVTLVELTRRILDATGAWRDVEAMSGAARLSARLNLYRFLDLAEAWSPLEGRPSLDAFLDYLELLAEEHTDELDAARLSAEDAVALLTVHRAKGLEWPVVFVPAVYRHNFPASTRQSDDPFRFPNRLPFDMRLDAAQFAGMELLDEKTRKNVIRARHDKQEWRTAYVATTRAKHAVYLTGAFWYTTKQSTKPSEFFTLAGELKGAERLVSVDEPGPAPDPAALGPGGEGAPDPLFEEGWETAARRALEDREWPAGRAAELGVTGAYDAAVDDLQGMLFDLPDPVPEIEPQPLAASVTALVTYATCPLRYFWSEVDRLPRQITPSSRRGVEFHRRIELHNRGAVPLDEATDDTYDVAPDETIGEGGTDAYAAFRESRFAADRPRFVEAPFDLLVGGARVRGRIDAIYEPEPSTWEVVDFKSGRRSENPAARVQLEAYGLAAAEAGFAPGRPDRLAVTFAYFGRGLEEVTETVDDGWIDAARHHLERMIEDIEAARFDPAPSPACHTCDFLQFCETGQAWVNSPS